MNVELIISNEAGTVLYQPSVQEGITLITQRFGAPGKLTFSVMKDATLNFHEGSAVRLTVDGVKMFFGFVFKKSRTRDQIISVTAYDQLRYLQNKDTKAYEGKKASELIRMLAEDFGLKLGSIADTGYVIPSRIEENTSLFDMIGNALDMTVTNTGNMFVLYDDFGQLALKSLADMRVGSSGEYLMIDEESAQNYEYESSIDSDTYDRVKLTYDNEDTGKRDVYMALDSTNINRWGVLQYFDTLEEGENGQAKADALLKLYNQKSRKLVIRNAFGDCRVRAGSMVIVNLGLGDISVQNFMLVEKCVHTFKESEHLMDLTLRGGEFNA